MRWIGSQELANLLGWKTKFCAIAWAKQQSIKYLRKGSGYFGRYWFPKKEVLNILDERKKIVTVNEAAKILGIHPSTFKRWSRQGRIKAIGRGRRKTQLFKKAQIVRLKPPSRVWVTWQENMLVKGYNKNGFFRDKLAQQIGKSIYAVGSKASHLGLGKNNQRDFYFLKDVAEHFKISRYRVARWIKNGKLKAEPIKSPGQRVRYRIYEEEIVKFMAQYPKAWQGLKPLINLLNLPEYRKYQLRQNSKD